MGLQKSYTFKGVVFPTAYHKIVDFSFAPGNKNGWVLVAIYPSYAAREADPSNFLECWPPFPSEEVCAGGPNDLPNFATAMAACDGGDPYGFRNWMYTELKNTEALNGATDVFESSSSTTSSSSSSSSSS